MPWIHCFFQIRTLHSCSEMVLGVWALGPWACIFCRQANNDFYWQLTIDPSDLLKPPNNDTVIQSVNDESMISLLYCLGLVVSGLKPFHQTHLTWVSQFFGLDKAINGTPRKIYWHLFLNTRGRMGSTALAQLTLVVVKILDCRALHHEPGNQSMGFAKKQVLVLHHYCTLTWDSYLNLQSCGDIVPVSSFIVLCFFNYFFIFYTLIVKRKPVQAFRFCHGVKATAR